MTNNTSDISSIKKDNHVDLNNYSFEECKEIIKESYLKKTNLENNLNTSKIKLSDKEKRWIYLILSGIISGLSLLLIPCFYDISKISYINQILLIFILLLQNLFLIFAIFKFKKSKNESVINYKKRIKSNFIKTIDYFLPLSKNELLIILKNNSGLKEYVRKNNNVIYSQYEIDKHLGIFSNNNFFKKGCEITPSFLNVNNVDFTKIKDTINNEQEEAIFSNNDCNLDNEYKVIYSIENGPKKEIFFKYTHCDKELFKKHIRNSVESEYGRKFEILSIDLIK